MTVLEYSISVFVMQLVFIGARTWNVSAIANKDMRGALMSGAVVHISWLVSISIGVISMKEIMLNLEWRYLPVVVCSLVGGLLGTYVALKKKK